SAALAAHTPASLAAVMRGAGALMVPAAQAAAARVPVVVVVGTEDPLAPRGRELAARWPGARFREVPGADHVTIVARPEALAEIRALVRRAGSTQRTAGGDTPAAAQQQRR
ncbi:MAG TPA: alpha/beta fold hydrolase, partial [Longimicrobium sp.]